MDYQSIKKKVDEFFERPDCAEILERQSNQLGIVFIDLKDESKHYDDGHCGQVAKKYGVAVGSIGCKHCGCSHNGAICNSICDLCGEDMFN